MKNTQMIDKSNFDTEQYKMDLQSAYDCGYAYAMSVIDDIKTEIDNQYKWLMQTNHTLYDIDIAFDTIKHFIDKHIGERREDAKDSD